MTSTSNAAEKLNGLLQGEISAVETYSQALEKISDENIKSGLQKCRECHSDRVDALKSEVRRLGGEPSDTSGMWGAFAKMMEAGATAFGDKAAIGILEEGEDKGLKDYREVLEEPEESIHGFVKNLLPKQEKTHETLANIKHSFH